MKLSHTGKKLSNPFTSNGRYPESISAKMHYLLIFGAARECSGAAVHDIVLSFSNACNAQFCTSIIIIVSKHTLYSFSVMHLIPLTCAKVNWKEHNKSRAL